MIRSLKRVSERIRTRSRAFGADENGATLVEMALITPPFLFLLMAIFQIGFVFTTGQVVENVTSELARMIRTGQAQAGGWSKERFTTEFCNGVSVFIPCTPGDPNLLIDVQVLPNFGSVSLAPPIDDEGKFTTPGTFSMGNRGQIVVVRVFYQYRVWLPFAGATLSDLPNGKRLIAASAAFRNEPFPGPPPAPAQPVTQ